MGARRLFDEMPEVERLLHLHDCTSRTIPWSYSGSSCSRRRAKRVDLEDVMATLTATEAHLTQLRNSHLKWFSNPCSYIVRDNN